MWYGIDHAIWHDILIIPQGTSSLEAIHYIIVNIVVLNGQQCNQCLKCQVSGHKIFKKSENFPNI